MTMREEYLELRRAILKQEYQHLNEKQREAVFAANGPLLILAGAGSGKTTVLINRIAYLIRYGNAYESDDFPAWIDDVELDQLDAHLNHQSQLSPERLAHLLASKPVKPWKILAITFTNKAAAELRERLSTALSREAADAVWASTFHSACVRILRKHCERIGYRSGFTIYDSDDQKRVYKEVLEALHLTEKQLSPRDAATIVSGAKDKLQTPEQFAAFVKQEAGKKPVRDQRMEIMIPVYEGYQRRLMEANAMDFDDLIMKTVELFETCPDVLEEYRQKFEYILVDEYQDTNRAQYQLVSLLANPRRNICVVGDDDQSIYRFRGATIENILGFEDEYRDARVIRLEQNYRSTAFILNAANAVIRNNRERKGKTLWTAREGGTPIVDYTAESEVEESSYVAECILKNIANGTPWKNHTVLYRMNAQSNALELAFRKHAIPYRIIGGIRFFDRAEVKDMLAYLQVIANHADTLRLKRIINTPPRGIGQKSINEAVMAAEQTGTELFDILRYANNYDGIAKGAQASMLQLADMITSLSEMAKERPLDELYDILLERSHYVDALLAKPSDENKTRLENIQELKTNILHYMKEADEPSLDGFLEEIALFTDIDRYDAESDAVTMMTIHSSKGLEFPNVFIVGMEEGIFPGMRSMEHKEDMEEERRLAYVGITRARDTLTLTHAMRHMLFGQTSHNQVSRFLEELPDDCVVREGGVPIRKEEPRLMGGSRFDAACEWIPKRTTGSRTASYAFNRSETVTSTKKAEPPRQDEPLFDYQPGMQLEHRAFGRGVLLSVKPTAGDLLLEIDFEQSGKKRLMAKFAQKYLKII